MNRGVDRGRRVSRFRDEERVDRKRRGGSGSAGPRGARRIALRNRNRNVVAAACVLVQERRLARHGAGGQRGEGRVGEGLRGDVACVAGEHLVPHRVGPAVELAVAREELLLRAVDDGAAGELGIRDEPAAGEAGVAVIEEEEQAVDVDAADRSGLRDRIEVVGVGAARILRRRRGVGRVLARQVDVERQVRQRPPEVVEPCAAAEALVERDDGAVDDDVVRAEPKTCDAHVVAHLEDERVRRRAIRAGLEEERVALAPKLVVHLQARHRVERRLDLPLGHGRVENDDVWAEVRHARNRVQAHRQPRRRPIASPPPGRCRAP